MGGSFGYGGSCVISGTTLTELTSIKPPSLESDDIEITAHNSLERFKDYLKGISDGGEIEIEGDFNTTDFTFLQNAMTTSSLQSVTITLPTTPTKTVIISNGFVTGLECEDPVDDKMEYSSTLKLTGKPSILLESDLVPTYILDNFSNIAVAYSIRQLKTGVTNAIRIRRDNDNTETDIGFVNGQLDTATITSFVGSNTAYITTWYDQSGNNLNAVQTNTANQPRIVNAGTIDNGIVFNGTSSFFDIPNNAVLNITQRLALSIVSDVNADSTGYVFCRNVDALANAQYGTFYSNVSKRINVVLEGADRTTSSALTLNTKYSVVANYTSTNVEMYTNNSVDNTVAFSTALTNRTVTTIGARGNTAGARSTFFNGDILEVILFSDSLDSNSLTALYNSQQASFSL
jgi:hypothetical protein